MRGKRGPGLGGIVRRTDALEKTNRILEMLPACRSGEAPPKFRMSGAFFILHTEPRRDAGGAPQVGESGATLSAQPPVDSPPKEIARLADRKDIRVVREHGAGFSGRHRQGFGRRRLIGARILPEPQKDLCRAVVRLHGKKTRIRVRREAKCGQRSPLRCFRLTLAPMAAREQSECA